MGRQVERAQLSYEFSLVWIGARRDPLSTSKRGPSLRLVFHSRSED